MILQYLKDKKVSVDSTILTITQDEQKFLSKISSINETMISRLKDFYGNGKGIRGVLVLLGNEMFGGKEDENILRIAAAMEIIHSALLVHDDIMDNDRMRRGTATLFHQYEEDGVSKEISNPYIYGVSMGICIGDICLYSAIRTITNLPIEAGIKATLLSYLTEEILKVGLAQMMDTYYGCGLDLPSIKDIETVYLYKTGRYTFVLPLVLGAVYAGQKIEDLDDLEKMGEYLGIVFQIVDDWLGIFAEEEDLGKPLGSDIREDKKTLIRNLLFSKVQGDDKDFLDSVFGNADIQKQDVEKVRDLIISYNVKDEIETTVRTLSEKASLLISVLEISAHYKKLLLSLVEYNKTRFK